MEKHILFTPKIARYFFVGIIFCTLNTALQAAEIGISSKSIKIASVLDLKGKTKNTGVSVLNGLKAAIQGEIVQGRKIKLITKNDFGKSNRSKDAINSLISRKPFLFIGNTEASESPSSLPLLMKHKTPAIGLINGSDKLRLNQPNIINFRASHIQEIETVVRSAIDGGIKPTGICIYVQNDDFGMMAVKGVKNVFQELPNTKDIIIKLDTILLKSNTNPSRNNIGPVGVYKPKTYISRHGYDSLKNWENNEGTRCKLIVTMGDQDSISRFVGYSRYKDEKWVISLASSTDTLLFQKALNKFNDSALISNRLVLTHVTPYLDSDIPLVVEAHDKLGKKLNHASLEAFISAKIMLHTLRTIEGKVNQTSFLDTIQNSHFDLGGLDINFTQGNQGSNLVAMSTLKDKKWVPLDTTVWQNWKR